MLRSHGPVRPQLLSPKEKCIFNLSSVRDAAGVDTVCGGKMLSWHDYGFVLVLYVFSDFIRAEYRYRCIMESFVWNFALKKSNYRDIVVSVTL